jgi:hypothetical protein
MKILKIDEKKFHTNKGIGIRIMLFMHLNIVYLLFMNLYLKCHRKLQEVIFLILYMYIF